MIKSFSGQVVFYFAILIAISAYVGENRLSQYTYVIFYALSNRTSLKFRCSKNEEILLRIDLT